MIYKSSYDLRNKIDAVLLAEHKKEKEGRISSGKLTASILGDPLQWQVLKVLGAPTKPFDAYSLGVFARGKQVEDWIVGMMDAQQTQVEVNYRNCLGFVDAIVDGIPHEVKSVKNSKFARITQENKPQRGHVLQACFYAMALKAEKFCIDYVATDDFRTMSFEIPTIEYSSEVDDIISRFEAQMASKTIPNFEAIEKWQATPEWNKYPNFAPQDTEQIDADGNRFIAKELHVNLEEQSIILFTQYESNTHSSATV